MKDREFMRLKKAEVGIFCQRNSLMILQKLERTLGTRRSDLGIGWRIEIIRSWSYESLGKPHCEGPECLAKEFTKTWGREPIGTVWVRAEQDSDRGRETGCLYSLFQLSLPFALELTLLRHECCSYQDHTWPPCCYALWTMSALILGGPRASSDIVDHSLLLKCFLRLPSRRSHSPDLSPTSLASPKSPFSGFSSSPQHLTLGLQGSALWASGLFYDSSDELIQSHGFAETLYALWNLDLQPSSLAWSPHLSIQQFRLGCLKDIIHSTCAIRNPWSAIIKHLFLQVFNIWLDGSSVFLAAQITNFGVISDFSHTHTSHIQTVSISIWLYLQNESWKPPLPPQSPCTCCSCRQACLSPIPFPSNGCLAYLLTSPRCLITCFLSEAFPDLPL